MPDRAPAEASPGGGWRVGALAALLTGLAGTVVLGLEGTLLHALAGVSMIAGLVVAATAIVPRRGREARAVPAGAARVEVEPTLDLDIGAATEPLIYDGPTPRHAPTAALDTEPAAYPGEGPWDGHDRRGPNRARNVRRLPSRRPAATPGDEDQWEAF